MADNQETEKIKETADDAQSVENIKRSLHETKVDEGKKSIWQMSLETFGMADGKAKKTDTTTPVEDEALELLKGIVNEQEPHSKWEFSLSPLEQFSATKDDLYLAFVRWSKKDEEENADYNVSKAFRRMEAYAGWMENNRKDLEEPLTVDSIRNAAKLWGMKITHDKKGRLVWWIDLGTMGLETIKKELPHKDSLRYIVWQAHLVMLDAGAQQNGMIFAEAMALKGMFECFTVLPIDLGAKLDRLTIGCMPVKMKACYIIHGAKWIHIVTALMQPFLSNKMRQRIIVVPKTPGPQQILDEEVGRDHIPAGFGELEGGAVDELIFGKFLKE